MCILECVKEKSHQKIIVQHCVQLILVENGF